MKKSDEWDYLEELKECPYCHKMAVWGTMTWLNGKCTCVPCYEKRKAELKMKEGK